MTRIILASGSPRRQELFKILDLPFETIVSDIDETINENGDLSEEITALAYRKALKVFKENPDALVIGADTIVTLEGKILGKPHDVKQAEKMLKELSGKEHQVITGVAMITQKRSESFFNISFVHFYPLSVQEISAYVKTGEPLDKAGAYAIQGLGSKFIKGIVGDYYAIMGLPIGEIYHRIEKYL